MDGMNLSDRIATSLQAEYDRRARRNGWLLLAIILTAATAALWCWR